MAGRKNKPQALRLAQGIVSHKKRKHEPNVQTVEILPPPDHLNSDEKAEWRDITWRLSELGMLTRLDSAAIALWCQTRVTYEDSLRRARKEPYDKRTGRRNAAWVTVHESRLTLLRLASDFGMSPSARAKLATVNPPKVNDDFDAWADSA